MDPHHSPTRINQIKSTMSSSEIVDDSRYQLQLGEPGIDKIQDRRDAIEPQQLINLADCVITNHHENDRSSKKLKGPILNQGTVDAVMPSAGRDSEIDIIKQADRKIQGLSYFQKYASLEEQANLVELIDRHPWEIVRRGGMESRVQRYGVVFDFKAGTVSDLNDIRPVPKFLKDLSIQLQKNGHFEVAPECFIINEYLPGQQLPPHIDVIEYWGNKVATISLLSSIEMNFIHAVDKEKRQNAILHPGSLLTIEGEARYDWKHGIKGRTTDLIDGQVVPRERRVSISFRNIRKECFSSEALKLMDLTLAHEG